MHLLYSMETIFFFSDLILMLNSKNMLQRHLLTVEASIMIDYDLIHKYFFSFHHDSCIWFHLLYIIKMDKHDMNAQFMQIFYVKSFIFLIKYEIYNVKGIKKWWKHVRQGNAIQSVTFSCHRWTTKYSTTITTIYIKENTNLIRLSDRVYPTISYNLCFHSINH